VIARMMWSFDIKKGLDENRNEIDVDDMALTDFFTVRPLPFKARFLPRGDWVKRVVEDTWDGMEKDVNVILNSIGEKRKSYKR